MTGHSARWHLVVPSMLVLAALFYCYWDVFAVLGKQWSTNDAYSHGFLIPAISLYVVWRNRYELAKLPLAGAFVTGTAVLVIGLGVLLLGRVIDIGGIQQLSLLPSLAGLALLVAGREALRAVWFPIAYLAFMMPVWDIVTERLHYPFQQLSARLGGHLLQTAGIPVLQHETYLQLPNVTLEVARVCSGVNYLVAVAAIGVPLAYLAFPDWLRRGLLVGFGLAVAILANPVRVALIGVFSHFGLSTDLHGPAHIFQGLFVAAVGYGALLCGVAVLSRWKIPSVGRAFRPAGKRGRPSFSTDLPRPTATDHERKRGLSPFSAHVVHMAVATVLLLSAGTLTVPALTGRTDTPEWLGEVPASIGAWQRIERATLSQAPSDAPRIYRNQFGQQVELRFAPVIPSYGTSAHAWSDAITLQATPLSLDLSRGEAVTVNRATDGRGTHRMPVLYWYDVDGRVSSDRMAAKLHTMWHRFTGRGRRPVTVFVLGTASGAGTEEEVLAAAAGFARELLAALRTPFKVPSAARATQAGSATDREPTLAGQP